MKRWKRGTWGMGRRAELGLSEALESADSALETVAGINKQKKRRRDKKSKTHTYIYIYI